MINYTFMPDSGEERSRRAEFLLDEFGKHTTYQHRGRNQYLAWLDTHPQLAPDAMYKFFNFWYPVSRHQPQMLLAIAAAYPEWTDRVLIMKNYLEEDGVLKDEDDPHYVLLERLIVELGGKLDVDPRAEQLVNEFHRTLAGMTAAQATGYVAAIEHPALDISDYFCKLATLLGRVDLLTRDPYLRIHVEVEPRHIIWSHGNALEWMENTAKQQKEGFKGNDVLEAYSRAMGFWIEFWHLAFQKLGYPQDCSS